MGMEIGMGTNIVEAGGRIGYGVAGERGPGMRMRRCGDVELLREWMFNDVVIHAHLSILPSIHLSIYTYHAIPRDTIPCQITSTKSRMNILRIFAPF